MKGLIITRFLLAACVSSCVLTSCSDCKPNNAYSDEAALGCETIRDFKVLRYDKNNREICSYDNAQRKVAAHFKSTNNKKKEVVVNIDLGKFYDIDGFGNKEKDDKRVVKYLQIQYYGGLNYYIHSVTEDFKEVLSVSIPMIPIMTEYGTVIDGSGGGHGYVEGNDLQRYLYKKNGFDYPNGIYYTGSSWNPHLHGALGVSITPMAKEAIAIVMKMLRGESLNDTERVIAEKYRKQVDSIIKK